MRIRCIVASALLALSTSGCWFQGGFGPARTGHNDLESTVTTANVDQLEVAWTASVDGAPREAVIAEGRVFARWPGGITALRLRSGEELWSVTEFEPLPGVPFPLGGDAVPAVAGDDLLVPAATSGTSRMGPCTLVTLDPSTGSVHEARSSSPFPEIPGEFIMSWECSTDDALVEGAKVVVPWSMFFQYVEPTVCRPDPEPIGIVGPGLAALDDDPAQNWGVDFTESGCGVVTPSNPPFGSASLVNGEVVVPNGPGLFAYAVDGCGSPNCPGLWAVHVGGAVVGPAVALTNGDIAVARGDAQVVVVDGTTHAVEWTGGTGATALTVPVAATPTSLFATYPDGTVAAFPVDGCGATTCEPTWTATLASPASARPSIGGDVLYVGSADGTVTALPANGCAAATCDPVWFHSTGSAISGAPAIWNGTIVVGSDDGTVTAFALP